MHRDYRLFAIHSRLSSLKLVVPIISPKGGVGKSTVSAMLSLALTDRGISTGLLDLDITNPALHIILGINIHSIKLEEVKGIKPFRPLEGLEFMSIAFFTRGAILPVRGSGIVNVVRDLLAITNWNSTVLVVDTPPGFSDEVLELLLLLHTVNPHVAKPLIITGQSVLSFASTKQLLNLIRRERFEPLGVLCNMCSSAKFLQETAEAYNVEILGCVPFIQNFEEIIGDAKAILKSARPYFNGVIDKILSIVKA